MSRIQCFMQGCRLSSVFACSCRQDVFYCFKHFEKHLGTEGVHVVLKIDEESLADKEKYYQYDLNQSLSIVKKNIKKLLEFINNINKLSNELLQALLREKEMIKQLLNTISKPSLDQDLINSIIEGKTIITRDLGPLLEDGNKLIQSLFINSIKLKSKPFKDDDFALIFSFHASNKIRLIDLSTFKQTEINLKINDFVSGCSCCKIDDNRFCIYGGGSSSTLINTCKILDIKNRIVQPLPPSIGITAAGSCILNEELYVFGGCTYESSPSNLCQKFSFRNFAWSRILPLPERNFKTTTFLADWRIYVAGFQSAVIFEYDSVFDRFACSKVTLDVNSLKFLIQNWIVCFGDALYEMDENGIAFKRGNFLDSGINLNSFTFFKRKDDFFFLVNPVKLYRIKTRTKKIESICVMIDKNEF